MAKEVRGELSGWRDITIEVIVPDQPSAKRLTIDDTLSDQALLNYGPSSSQTKKIRTIAYFKIKDGNEIINEFDPKLEIHVKYTPRAWESAANSPFGAKIKESEGKEEVLDEPRPTLHYRARFGDEWSDDWINFEDDDTTTVQAILPGDVDDFGYLTLYVKCLPDPAVGDPGDPP
jgi:hypothetical protein